MTAEYLKLCKIFQENYQNLKESKGVTYKVMSMDTGISRSTLCYLGCGYSIPSDERLKILEDYFGVEQGYLLTKH